MKLELKTIESMLKTLKNLNKQHEETVKLISYIAEAQENRDHQNAIKQTYNLLDYWSFQFKYEEKLMKGCEYHEYSKHQYEHENIIRKISVALDVYSSGEKTAALAIVPLLRIWSEEHMEDEDNKLVEYLKSKRVI